MSLALASPTAEQASSICALMARVASRLRAERKLMEPIRKSEIEKLRLWKLSPEGQRKTAEAKAREVVRIRNITGRINTPLSAARSLEIRAKALAMIGQGIPRHDIATALGFSTFESVRYHLPDDYSNHCKTAIHHAMSDKDLMTAEARMLAGESGRVVGAAYGIAESTLRKKINRMKMRLGQKPSATL